MSNQTYIPGPGNTPFGNTNTNPQASQYGIESQFNPTEEILIAKAIRKIIFDAAPAKYNSMKLLYSKPFKEYGGDEFEYLEKTFGRTAIVADQIAALQAAVPGANQTQTFNVTAATASRLSLDLILVYPDNTHAVIVGIVGVAITVNSNTNFGLPAVAVGDVFAVEATIRADAMDTFNNYERMETITRYNYIQFFLRAQRWGRVELQKHKNLGTTNYLQLDMDEKVKQLRIDMFNSYWNGQRGEYPISGNFIAKSMGGINPTMLAAGSATANPTVAGLKSAFETLAFQTDFKVEGGTRFIYATSEMLHNFSNIYKQPGLRYEPSDEIANLKLNRIELGGQNFVLVPCELFRETSCFPVDWQRKIFVLDQEAISPVKMKGIPQFEMGGTLALGKNGTREDFEDFFVKGQLSLEYNNPQGGFILNVQ